MKVIVNEKQRKRYVFFSTHDLKEGKIYETMGERKIRKDGTISPFIRIIDESGEDYLYHISLFDIIEE